MEWERLLTMKRFGLEKFYNPEEKHHDSRSEFQRDFDRLVFSAPFRRLQNKTQVFPLPGSVFVHNRLTHSLEVSCVGRSLGNNASVVLQERHPQVKSKLDAIGSITQAACLAHDMGNPPFGHSGEKAINTYFSEGNGAALKSEMTAEQWSDCTHFEGNANAFRILTHQFRGRREGGFVMTYPTIASIVKYPYPSIASKKKGKFGFFDSDKQNYEKIAKELGIEGTEQEVDLGGERLKAKSYPRFPIVYLVEAADDICYQIMDIEDAHKLKILTTQETIDLFMQYFSQERKEKIRATMGRVSDINEQIAYLRSCVIGNLIDCCTECFLENEEKILNGKFEGSLIKNIDERSRQAYEVCAELSVRKIYRSAEVLDVELAGYKIIYMLMEELIKAVFNPEKAYSKQLLERIPQQYDINAQTPYEKVEAMLDYVSGMTDVYALGLYQKITGMSLPQV